jgi:hypothetical protein
MNARLFGGALWSLATPLPGRLRESGGMNKGSQGQLNGSGPSGGFIVRPPENEVWEKGRNWQAPKLSDMGISSRAVKPVAHRNIKKLFVDTMLHLCML